MLPKVICTVVSACVAAYGFGRFDFPGRKLLFNIMLATLFLPQVVLNVPQYLLYNKFGWLDSPFYLAIWVHCAFATETYFVYQLIQFMRNVPRDLDEAAAIDGCSSFQTLYKVIVPMLMPALVSCALFQFMGTMTLYRVWKELQPSMAARSTAALSKISQSLAAPVP